MIVLDASLTVAWLLDEHHAVLPPALRDALPDVPIRVPAHWPVEVANALSVYLRARRIPASDLVEFMYGLDGFEIHVEPSVDLDAIGPLAQFAITQELTAYDAAYVQLALHDGAILATLDKAMRAAAQRLRIPLLPA